ncbi:MAG: hypothetical protein V1719_00395 [Patescibacteria group bacterium]
MIIPSVGFDLWPMYSLIGLLILASFSNWVWRIIIAKYPLENWWCGDQTDSRWAQHPPASAVVVPEELFYGNNEELINLMVIPGRDICPRIIQELVSKFWKI